MRYGERLGQLREKAGLTQEQLAERSGVNLWTLRGYEQGRREPSWKAALSLAAALGVAAEAFADCEEGTAEDTDQQDKRPRGRPRKAPAVAQETSAAGKATSAPSGEKKPARGHGRKGKG
jgi:transcriptional regulator with XRE-family HTH domain